MRHFFINMFYYTCINTLTYKYFIKTIKMLSLGLNKATNYSLKRSCDCACKTMYFCLLLLLKTY